MTGGAGFVTPLAAGALCGERAYTDLFDAKTEFDVGHIRLARDTDLIVVAPATADLMAKMAGGHADDLASAVLLATDKPVLIAPAMNPRMWAARRRSAISRRLSPTACASSAPTPARWRSTARPASAVWRSRWRSSPRPRRCCAGHGPARGQARARHGGTDPRADRPGALHRQPLLRQAGLCDRERGGCRRR